MRALLAGEVDEEAVEGGDGDVAEFGGAFREHGDALFDREERVLGGIAQDGNDQVVEDFRGARDQVEVAVG